MTTLVCTKTVAHCCSASIVGLVDKKAGYNAPNSPLSLTHTLSFSLLSSVHRYNIDVLLSEDK